MRLIYYYLKDRSMAGFWEDIEPINRMQDGWYTGGYWNKGSKRVILSLSEYSHDDKSFCFIKKAAIQPKLNLLSLRIFKIVGRAFSSSFFYKSIFWYKIWSILIKRQGIVSKQSASLVISGKIHMQRSLTSNSNYISLS